MPAGRRRKTLPQRVRLQRWGALAATVVVTTAVALPAASALGGSAPAAQTTAATRDRPVLFVVLERRPRALALVPMVVLLVASGLFPAGVFFGMLLGPARGPWRAERAVIALLAVTAGMLIKPSGILGTSLGRSRA